MLSGGVGDFMLRGVLAWQHSITFMLGVVAPRFSRSILQPNIEEIVTSVLSVYPIRPFVTLTLA
jgi:hypothetical protein